VRIACSHCHKLFVPSRSHRSDLGYGVAHHRYYCSHECKCAGKRTSEQTSPTAVLPKPPPINWTYDLHVRTADVRAFRRLLRALDDDIELVRVQRSEGRRYDYVLQMVTQPARSGSIADLIRQAAPRKFPLVPEDLSDGGRGPGTASSAPAETGGHPDEAAEK
jgi:hypothetical protein